MYPTAAMFVSSTPSSTWLSRERNLTIVSAISSSRTCSSLRSSIFSRVVVFRNGTNHGPIKKRALSKPFSPVMQWQDCTVKMEIDVPISVAYDRYSDREAIPTWMPFISSVKPIPNQKIHWRSLEGLPNRGAVRFFPKSPTSCIVELTVSYEVPQLLSPVASLLQPFLESLLRGGLERFVKAAKSSQTPQ